MKKRNSRRRKEIWSGGKCVRRVYVHRLVVEQAIGRTLLSTEIVHHINGNAEDNRLDNLLVLSSQAAHMFLHHYIWRKEAGAGQVFTPFEVVRIAGEDVIWGTEVGLRKVFGVDARAVLAKLQNKAPADSEAQKAQFAIRSRSPERRGTDGYRKWFSEFRSQLRLPGVHSDGIRRG